MPHITFIHGLANKPAEDTLKSIWTRALSAGDGLDLDDLDVSYSMVYWADVLYAEPDTGADELLHESATDDELAAADGSDQIPAPETWVETEEEALLVDALFDHFSSASIKDIESGEAPAPNDPAAVALERVPLPWFIKRRIMKSFARDAHHYYFDKTFTPRPGGQTYHVRDEIRRRFINEIAKPRPKPGPNIVVAHSMGTMIAYDCLKRVAHCPEIDGLMTLGSPLGIDEIQDCNKPEWSRKDGFPHAKLRGRWINVFDRLDVVCAADPRLANDFRHGGNKRIEDIGVSNDGAWRHSIVKYLGQAKVRDALASLLTD